MLKFNMSKTSTAFASIVCLFVFTAHAKLAKKGEASVQFFAKGTVPGLSINGKGSDLMVSDDGANLTVIAPLGNLKTGIDLRDKHMKEKYLHTDKFPNAELVVARSALKIPASGDASGEAEGTFKIHGQSKSARFRYEAKREGSTFHVVGKVSVNITDFGVEKPSHLGVGVKPEIDLEVRFDVEEK